MVLVEVTNSWLDEGLINANLCLLFMLRKQMEEGLIIQLYISITV